MRFARLIVAGVVAGCSVSAAHAQTAPVKSAEEIVCELTGECGDQETAAGAELAKPDEAEVFLRAEDRRAVGPAPRTELAKADKVVKTTYRKPVIKKKIVVAKTHKVGTSEMRIGFQLGKAELTDADRTALEQYVVALQTPQLARRKLRIEGHTDAIGEREANLQLSIARAAAVRDFLVSKGVADTRLESEGFGFDRLLVPSRPTAAANRRVEIKLVD